MRVAIKREVLKSRESAFVPKLSEQRGGMGGVGSSMGSRLDSEIHVGDLDASVSCGKRKARRVDASEGREGGDGGGGGEWGLAWDGGWGINSEAV
jgi:hypothetical protein